MNTLRTIITILYLFTHTLNYCASDVVVSSKSDKKITPLSWIEKTNGQEVQKFIDRLPVEMQQHIGRFVQYAVIQNFPQLPYYPSHICSVPKGGFIGFSSKEGLSFFNKKGEAIKTIAYPVLQIMDCDDDGKFALVSKPRGGIAVLSEDKDKKEAIEIKNALWARFYYTTQGSLKVVYNDYNSLDFYTLNLETQKIERLYGQFSDEKKLLQLENTQLTPYLSSDRCNLVFPAILGADEEAPLLNIVHLPTGEAYRTEYVPYDSKTINYRITPDEKLLFVSRDEEPAFTVVDYKNPKQPRLVLPYPSRCSQIYVPQSIPLTNSYIVIPQGIGEVPTKIDVQADGKTQSIELVTVSDKRLYLHGTRNDTNCLTLNGEIMIYCDAIKQQVYLMDLKTGVKTIIHGLNPTEMRWIKGTKNGFLIGKRQEQSPHREYIETIHYRDVFENQISPLKE